MAAGNGGKRTSRRRFLTGAAAVAGGVAAESLLPPSLRQALAAPLPPQAGGLGNIEHVIFLMQENRAFDHYYGMLKGVRGYSDRSAITLPDGRSVFQQPGTGALLTSAYYEPFLARNGRSLPPGHWDPNTIGGLPHDWDPQHQAFADGWHNNWIAAKEISHFLSRWLPGWLVALLQIPGFATTMAHYDRTDIPFHYELADTFTICDAYHASVIGGTNPNRLYHYVGKLGVEPDGTPSINNNANEGSDWGAHPGYDLVSLAQVLTAAGRSWKVYQEWDNFGDNGLEYLRTFREIGKKLVTAITSDDFDVIEHFYSKVSGYSTTSAQEEALAELEKNVANLLTDKERDLYERALQRARPGRLAEAFRQDVESGNLPQVSWIAAPLAQCEHPSGGTPVHAAYLIYQLLDVLGSNPDVWAKTALFLTYDENDGYFDHVPSPIPPPGTPGEFVDGAPIGLGFRVPMTVISPWSVGGSVCSETFDHTSTSRFVEQWLGVKNPNISEWRRQVCGDLTGAFDFATPKPWPGVSKQQQPDWDSPGFLGRWWPQPPWSDSDRGIPTQEPGHRFAKPLPYRPEVSAWLSDDGSSLEIAMIETGSRSTHLAAYAYKQEFDTPRHFDVSDRHIETVQLAGDEYRITVTGPNRFRRDFAGDRNGEAALVRVTSAADEKALTLSITLDNTHGSAALPFTIEAQAYGGGSKQVGVVSGGQTTVLWDATLAHGWYDLLITTTRDTSFQRRLMGHLENGAVSVSA